MKNPLGDKGLIRGIQANFDHLMGALRALARAHNVMVDDLRSVDDSVESLSGDVYNLSSTVTNIERTAKALPPGMPGEDGDEGFLAPPIPDAILNHSLLEIRDRQPSGAATVDVQPVDVIDFNGRDFVVTDLGNANGYQYVRVDVRQFNPVPWPGDEGEDGFFGVPGPQGETGATGATGATGPPGADGTGGGGGSAGLPAEAFEEGDVWGMPIPPTPVVRQRAFAFYMG